MKIGIITFFRKNYGAILQAYALQTTLESFGQSAEIIDYNAAAPLFRTSKAHNLAGRRERIFRQG